jgi:putative FmdB family regulatory protein
MPLYEYYCTHCDGVFERLKNIREAIEPSSCPVCDRDSDRIMPTSFTAFTFRDGLARRIPDRGTYWHSDGSEVKTMNTGGVMPNAHPELVRATAPATRSRGDAEDAREVDHLKGKHAKIMHDSGLTPAIGVDGKPVLSPKMGASGHV